MNEYSLKMQTFEREMCFNNACGLHSSPEHILLCRHIIWLRYSVQTVKIAFDQDKITAMNNLLSLKTR